MAGMFRLTREVRFAINAAPDAQLERRPSNSYGGYPSLTGLGRFYAVRVTLAGRLNAASHYLENIKTVDDAVRAELRGVEQRIHSGRMATPADVLSFLHARLYERFGERFDSIALALSPLLVLTANRSEVPMMRLSQKFEFSASHRLHNPSLSDDENRRTYGKCNNPLGHGHNYEVQVTLLGTPGPGGLLVDVPAFERIVAEAVIDRFDHRNLNAELAEFRELIPSVENIAQVIYGLLGPKLKSDRAQLASVTVWETPKTWCEYSEREWTT